MQLLPTSANGTSSFFSRIQAQSLHATLHVDHNKIYLGELFEEDDDNSSNVRQQNHGSGDDAWSQASLALKPSNAILQRLGGPARSLARRLSFDGQGSAISTRGSLNGFMPTSSRRMSSSIPKPEAGLPQPGSHHRPAVLNRQASVMRRFVQASQIIRGSINSPQPEIQMSIPTQVVPPVNNAAGIQHANPGDEGHADPAFLAVPVGSSEDPLLMVEYCTSWLPPDLARLPELDLGDGLARAMHCYAHGGFMGAAISMLADPEWEHILLDTVHETVSLASKKQVNQNR